MYGVFTHKIDQLSIYTHVSRVVTNAGKLLEMEFSNSIYDIIHRSLHFKLVP